MSKHRNQGVPKGLKKQMRERTIHCFYCGKRAFTGDHVVPRVQGGKGGWTNIVPACEKCNSCKSGRTDVEWRSERLATAVQVAGPLLPLLNVVALLKQCTFYAEDHDLGVMWHPKCGIMDRPTKETI